MSRADVPSHLRCTLLDMAVLILVALLVVFVGLGVAIGFRFFGTVLGIAFLLVFVAYGTFITMLQGIAETPDNSVGNPRRVHVRNESPAPIYVVARDRLAEDEVVGLRPVRPDELIVIFVRFFPAQRDLACTDDPMAIIRSVDGTPPDDVNGAATFDPDDVVVLAELVQCLPKGRNVVVWDGQRAFVDPDARPPLFDPEIAPMAYGWIIGAGVVLLGLGVDVLNVLERRRRRTVGAPANWPPPVVPGSTESGPGLG